MFRNTRAALAGLVVAAALAQPLAAQATQSPAGAWKLNAAKSTFDPADLGSKSSTVTYAFTDKSVTATIDQVNAKGQKVHTEYTATLDGDDSPWKGTIDGKSRTSTTTGTNAAGQKVHNVAVYEKQ